MSQRQCRRVEKGELQTQYSSSRPGRPGRAYSTPKHKYQWVFSTKVRGRGGDSDNAGLPPSDPHSSTNSRFSSVKKSDGQSSRSTVPRAISESNAVQNAPLEKSRLSGSSDASTSKTLARRTLWYRKRDTQIVSEAVSSQSESEAPDSATTRNPLRDGPSSRASPEFGSLQDFAHEMQADHNVSEEETAVYTSSISSKQQRNAVLEHTENESPQLQPNEDLEQSKNESSNLRPKAKRYIRLNYNSSIPGETDKSSITSKQLPKQDQEQSENENPHLQSRCDLEPSKNENPLQSKANLEQSKNEITNHQHKDNLEKSKSETLYLQPQTKRYIRVQQKLFKPAVTASTSSASNEQEAKRDVEKSNTKPPWLKAGEDFEESKDDALHPQPMVKRYIQVHHNFFKPEVTLSTPKISGRQQQKENLKQSRKEAPDLQSEAERDAHSMGVSASTVVASTEDVVRAVLGVPIATSSFQQSHIFNCLSIRRPRPWIDGITSTAFQMPVQFPSGNSSQDPEPPFVPSLQPYPLQLQGMMHYATGYNFSPQFGHQLESQFRRVNGITSEYMHNYLNKPASGRPVKITHPETNEELVLDNSANGRLAGVSSGTMTHHLMALQPQSVDYGPSPLMNYFSHFQPNSLSFRCPSSGPFRNSQMPSRTSRLGFNSLGIHDVDVAANAGHPSLVSTPVSKQALNFGEANKSSVSVRSATNDRKQATKPMDPPSVNCQRRKSNSYLKGLVQLPKSVASSSLTAVPLRESAHTVSFEGVPLRKGTSIDNDGISAIDNQYATMKELQNLSRECDSQSHKLPQADTSDFADNSNMESSDVGECCNNTLAPPKEIQQSDAVLGSPPSSQPSIPGSSKLEMINLEANPSSVDSCESSLAPSRVFLSGAQAGFPCTSVELSGELQTGKDLIHGVSSKHIGQNINMHNAVAIKDAQKINYAPSDVQVDAKTEDLSEQERTDLFEQPFLHRICKAGSLNNLGSLQINQQTKKVPSIAETSACSKHAISGFEQDGLQGSEDTPNAVAEKTGDAFVRYTSSISHWTDSTFESPTLDSSLECPETLLQALESRAEPLKVNEISLSESGNKNHEENRSIPSSIMMTGASFTGKQNRKEILCKADAAGTSANLSMASKECYEKLQFSDVSNCRVNRVNVNPRHVFFFSNEENVGANENVKSKTELGHQKGVEISNPKLEISNKFEVHQITGHAALDDVESSGRKSYSTDFLLKFSKHFTEFPAGSQFVHDMAEGLIISPKANIARTVDHYSRSSFVRNMDGPPGSSSVDYHGCRKDGHRRWTKSPTLIATEQHFGINGETSCFQPGRGGMYNKNFHGLVRDQYAGGTFTGLLPHPASQGGRKRKGVDVEKDLISSSKSTLQAMHKAEKKYEVHRVINAEEAKQRQLKAILNKLTPQNFDRLFQQVKEVNIDNAVTLAGLISQIFDKALMEPTFSEMYANFCYYLASELPDFVVGHEKITFKRLLLNKCQEEFERGEREQAEADRTDRDGEFGLSEEEREEKRIHARRRMLGNIRLIGELYKKKMLTERIMHACIEKLLRNDQFPEEEDIEALCKLMCTIGEIIDHPKAKEHMDACFEVMLNLSNNRELSTRMRFMLKDVIDLRKNKWQQRRKVEGPKKIEELHSDVAQERRAVGNQLTYTPRIFPSNKRVSTNSGSRPSNIKSPRKPAFRAMSSKKHGFASQDVWLDDRKLYEHGTLSVPFLQKSTDDNIMTVGVQGGLTKGMPLKDSTMFYSSSLTKSRTGFLEARKVPANPNDYSSIPELRPYNNLKQQLRPKYAPDILMQAPVYSPSNQQGHYVNRGSTSADGSFGRSLMTRTMIYPSRPTLSSKVSSGQRWSNEYLREMSMAAIQEFYSAGNENDIFQCVGNLNSPSFYPSMISIWVKDSFGRKDKERDLLAGLLVSLTKSGAGVLTTRQLIKGFELVLATLEVALTDVAKAAAFLGKLFGRIVTKNVISLKEIKRMVQQYGKVQGQPPQFKLGYEVMKIAFETIQSERGESVPNEMCKRFNVQLDDFRLSRTVKP